MWRKIIKISLIAIFLSIFLSILFFYIPNKSNFSKKYIIPIIVSLIIKYSIGDLDINYTYTISDLYYWFIILFIPYIVVIYLDK